MPAVRKFIQRYPEVNLEMVATSDELDLAAREADVALRGTDQPPPNLVGKCIAQIGSLSMGRGRSWNRQRLILVLKICLVSPG